MHSALPVWAVRCLEPFRGKLKRAAKKVTPILEHVLVEDQSGKEVKEDVGDVGGL